MNMVKIKRKGSLKDWMKNKINLKYFDKIIHNFVVFIVKFKIYDLS